MKITIAMDSLKGSLTSLEAGRRAAEGIRRVYPDAEIRIRPLADGGEGTVEALTNGLGGRLRRVSVTGPLGEPAQCTYGILPDSKTAVIEMAQAAGLTLIAEERRNPMHTTTYGVGEVILDAYRTGCRNFLIGIGGSATNDGGAGMLQALGYGLLKENGEPVSPGAAGLSELSWITESRLSRELSECMFRIACDVTNPLCGESGCSAVFGPQKGADPEMIQRMDQWLAEYARIVRGIRPDADPGRKGAGAAGGLGFAFQAFLHARLLPGAEVVMKETKLEEAIRDSDLFITGEGRLDAQTVMGKAPVRAAQLAKRYHKPVIAFAGGVTKEAMSCHEAGIDAFFPILREAVPLEEAMRPEIAGENLADVCEQVFRVIRIFYKDWQNEKSF